MNRKLRVFAGILMAGSLFALASCDFFSTVTSSLAASSNSASSEAASSATPSSANSSSAIVSSQASSENSSVVSSGTSSAVSSASSEASSETSSETSSVSSTVSSVISSENSSSSSYTSSSEVAVYYKVIFKDWDGTELANLTVLKGDTAVYPHDNPIRGKTAQYTYTFKGWDGSLENIQSNMIFNAVYDRVTNVYTVTFVNYNDNVLKTYQVEYGKGATYDGETPTKPSDQQYSYTFSGWDVDYSYIEGNTTVKAQFAETLNEYKVDFQTNGGTTIASEGVDYGKTATAPSVPTKEGYTFSGWYKDEALTEAWDFATDTVKDNTILYAKWTINSYSVTFQNQDGTVLETKDVTYGQTAVYSGTIPTMDHTDTYEYIFTGWDQDLSQPIKGKTTFTAVYFKASYGLEYTLNSDGKSYKVSGYHGSVTEVIIPTTYNLLPVTVIGANAFYDKSAVTSIEIPGSILTIESLAFHFCTGLTTITIPSSVTSLYSDAFSNCHNLAEIIVDPANSFYVSVNGILFDHDMKTLMLISESNPLTTYVIPSTVTSIDRIGIRSKYLEELTFPESMTTIETQRVWAPGLLKIVLSSSITSIAEYAFQGSVSVKEILIDSDILRNKYTIKDLFLGQSSSDNLISLTTVDFGSHVTYYSYTAFAKLNNLEAFNVDAANTTFSSIDGVLFSKDQQTLISYPCHKGTSYEIPSNVVTIGNTAFYGCNNLTFLKIPSTVKNVTYNTNNTALQCFTGCTVLSEIEIDSTALTSSHSLISYFGVSTLSFLTEVTIGAGVTLINGYFTGLTGLTVLNLDYTGWVFAKLFGTSSFTDSHSYQLSYTAYYWPNALKVNITGYSTASIADYAFAGCVGLNNSLLEIPSTITTIGTYAFQDCTSLNDIAIPSSVTSIGEGAFKGCNGITWISIDSNIIASTTMLKLFGYVSPTWIKNLTIGSHVTSIGDDAFKGLSGISSLVIPSSVTTLGNKAFADCTNLTAIDLSTNLTSIGDYCFYNDNQVAALTIQNDILGTMTLTTLFGENNNLQTVTIGENVTSLNVQAFNGCKALANIAVKTGNTHFQSVDGVLVSSEGVLLAYPNAKGTTYVIPSTIASIGEYAFAGASSLTSLTIPASITAIGAYAFKGCTGLVSLGIPSSVTILGEEILSGCTGITEISIEANVLSSLTLTQIFGQDPTWLTKVTIGKGVLALPKGFFAGCTGLTSLTLSYSGWVFPTLFGTTSFTSSTNVYYSGTSYYYPSNMEFVIDGWNGTIVAASAFYGCSGLTSLEIPATFTHIYDNAFKGCSALTSLTLPYTGWTWDGLFDSSVPATLTELTINGFYGTSIAASAFQNVSILKSIEIPSSITSIGDYAFAYCTGLTSLVIPSSVKSIGASAFANCSNLASLTMPYNGGTLSSVFDGSYPTSLTSLEINGCNTTSIPASAFANCTALTSIEIPTTVTSIGTKAFEGCSGLTSLTLPYTGWVFATLFGTWSFTGSASITYSSTTYYYPSALVVEVNGSSAKSLANYAFYGCKGLTSIVIPDTITTIGNYAFQDCTGLTSVTIPSSVKSLGYLTFGGCSGLTSIVLPSSLTSLGANVFSGCTGLTSLEIPNSVTSIGTGVFTSCAALTSLTLPYTGWDFASLFGSASFTGSTAIVRTYTYYYPTGLALTINGWNTTELASYAFSGYKELTSLEIPSSVTTIDNYAFTNCTGLTSLRIPSSVTTVGANGILNGCTGLVNLTIDSSIIATKSLYYLFGYTYPTWLSTVTIGASVTAILDGAFQGCSGLTAFIVEAGSQNYKAVDGVLYSFDGTTLVAYPAKKSETSFAAPSAVTSIGAYAFQGATNLTSLEIPTSVDVIGTKAFFGCSGLTSLTLPYTGWFFRGISDNLSLAFTINAWNTDTITSYAFDQCAGLTSLVIPSTVTTINEGAFGNCPNLVSLTLPYTGWVFYQLFNKTAFTGSTAINSYYYPSALQLTINSWNATSMANYAFDGYKGLTSLVIPDTVTSIGILAFYNCTGLTSVTIPSSVTTIGASIFDGCSSLETINLDAANPNYQVIDGILFNKAGTELIACPAKTSLTSFEIPSSVTSIDRVAFYNCSNLTSITIPTSVTTIGQSAFANCTGLTSLVVPSSVTNIDYSAFKGCTSLVSLTLPYDGWKFANICDQKAVSLTINGWNDTVVEDWAFQDCTGLTTLVIPSSVTKVGNSAFSGCTNLTIYCEATSLPSAWSTSWNTSFTGHYYWYAETETSGAWHYVSGVPTLW